ncbi:hypothetical protein CERZMDRAFT_105493 [Cercospora zeae-maydis SCOH1-5]|uniref:Condensation domain-containing protein n=1 Tax=Cercospora zeae-maydis SCOH1-5 TaxID=717836 RepID=A0A6A6FM08_9PEZI|nr:hypothetical protein CERZMDRAFT_105493 [Cercospora zeae-maydis SCOH1-5]
MLLRTASALSPACLCSEIMASRARTASQRRQIIHYRAEHHRSEIPEPYALLKTPKESGFRLSTAGLMMGRKLSELSFFIASYMYFLTNGSRTLMFTLRRLFYRLQQAVYRWFGTTDILGLSFTMDNRGEILQTLLNPVSSAWNSRIALESHSESFASLSAKSDFFKHAVLAILYSSAIDSGQSDVFLALQISHSIDDGTSTCHILHDLVNIYAGQTPETRPSFAPYLRRKTNQAFHSLSTVLVSGVYLKQRKIIRVASVTTGNAPEMTMSTVVHTAWSIVLSVLADSSDVVFSHSVHRRKEDFPGSEAVIECCVNEIPCQVILDDLTSSTQLMGTLQAQIIPFNAPHAQLGPSTIASKYTGWSQKGTIYDHSTLVVHQDVRIGHSWNMGHDGYMNIREAFFEVQRSYDFDLSTSSSSANELYLGITCLQSRYTKGELEAVVKGSFIAVRMSTGCAHRLISRRRNWWSVFRVRALVVSLSDRVGDYSLKRTKLMEVMGKEQFDVFEDRIFQGFGSFQSMTFNFVEFFKER